MEAGKLNRKITIQKKTIAKDADGYPAETWVDLKTNVPASIITTGGREFYAAQKMNAETSAVIKIRYRFGINIRMQVKYGNRIFEIIGIADPEERHEELLLSCREVIPGG